jgi:hypothetical protein
MNSGQAVETAESDFRKAAVNGDIAQARSAYENEIAMRNSLTAGFVGVGLGAALTTTGLIFTVPMFR